MPAAPIPYFKAWAAYVAGTLLVVIPGGGLAGLVFFGLAALAGVRENSEFLTCVAMVVQTAVGMPLSYLTFRFVTRQFILPAVYSGSRPSPPPE